MDTSSERQIDALTTQLEHGDASGVALFMHGKFEEERIRVLLQIQKDNQRHRLADSKVPELAVVSSSSCGDDYQSITLLPGGMGNAFGGKELYWGGLDLFSLRHNGVFTDAVPPSRHQVDARALTTRLELGNGQGVKSLVGSLYLEERIRLFNEVRKLNQDDLSQHKTAAELDVQIGSTKGGYDFIRVDRSLPGWRNWLSNEAPLYWESTNMSNLSRVSGDAVDQRIDNAGSGLHARNDGIIGRVVNFVEENPKSTAALVLACALLVAGRSRLMPIIGRSGAIEMGEALGSKALCSLESCGLEAGEGLMSRIGVTSGVRFLREILASRVGFMPVITPRGAVSLGEYLGGKTLDSLGARLGENALSREAEVAGEKVLSNGVHHGFEGSLAQLIPERSQAAVISELGSRNLRAVPAPRFGLEGSLGEIFAAVSKG